MKSGFFHFHFSNCHLLPLITFQDRFIYFVRFSLHISSQFEPGPRQLRSRSESSVSCQQSGVFRLHRTVAAPQKCLKQKFDWNFCFFAFYLHVDADCANGSTCFVPECISTKNSVFPPSLMATAGSPGGAGGCNEEETFCC